VSGSDKYYARDVVTPPIRAERGRVRVPRDHRGLGHEVDLEFIRATSTATATFSNG
jgi:O-succinylbenzoate synthase